jgi:hypothetical protein
MGTSSSDEVDATVAATVGSTAASATTGDDAALTRGDLVGRYIVLSRLGSGAMGVVYAAHDPDLDRKVALKLLQVARAGTDGTSGRTRLLREAQALARLSHPNVVAVHDVGEHRGNVWLAMELVEGLTLDAWLRDGSHGPREVLAILVQAGEGLAAAHAAALVHRDVKPENVLVASDGRARIADFGLARLADDDAPIDGISDTRASMALERLSARVTQAGSFVGTPAFAAPEQLHGGRTDEKADQFSFCVTAWQALYGERPFAGTTLVELAANVLAGRLRPPAAGRGVPRWVQRALERGLAVDPERRWPSVAALLGSLARGRARARRIRTTAAAVVVAGILGLAFAGQGWRERARAAACQAEGDRIAEVWNATRRGELERAFAGSEVVYAPRSFERAAEWIDDRARRWSDVSRRVCASDPRIAGLGRECLGEQRDQIEALIDALAVADAAAVRRAVAAAADLPAPELCEDATRLTRSVRPIDPAAREQAREIRRTLSRAVARQSAGAFEAGLAEARRALADAESIGAAELVIRARLRVGGLQTRQGEYAAAEAELRRAFSDALALDANDLAADAAISLTPAVGDALGATARAWCGQAWRRHSWPGWARIAACAAPCSRRAWPRSAIAAATSRPRPGSTPTSWRGARSCSDPTTRTWRPRSTTSPPSPRGAGAWTRPSASIAALSPSTSARSVPTTPMSVCRSATWPTSSRTAGPTRKRWPSTNGRCGCGSTRWGHATRTSPRCSTTWAPCASRGARSPRRRVSTRARSTSGRRRWARATRTWRRGERWAADRAEVEAWLAAR